MSHVVHVPATLRRLLLTLGCLIVVATLSSITSAQRPYIPPQFPDVPGAQHVDGDLRFPTPSEVHVGMSFQNEWFAHWRPVSGAPLPDLTAFAMEGDSVTLEYFQRTTTQNPYPLPPSTKEETESKIFERFHVSVAPQLSPQELLVWGRNKMGQTEESAAAPWKLSTIAPTERLLEHAPPRDAWFASSLRTAQWSMLLEGDQADVAAGQVGLVYVYGWNVTVRHVDGEIGYPTGLWNTTVQDLPGLPPRHVTKEAYLVLLPSRSSMHVQSSHRPVRILAPQLMLSGTFDLSSVQGRLASEQLERTFHGEAARLQGAFLFSANEPDSSSQHHVAVTGKAKDFDAASVSEGLMASPSVLIWTAVTGIGLAGLAALFWKPLISLFTRLRKDELLEQEGRRLVSDAVQANPGLTVASIINATGLKRGSVRHHLAILQHHGRVRAFKSQGAWRFAPAAQEVKDIPLRILLESDPKLQSLLDRIGPEGAPGQRVVEELRTQWGLSRSGGWYLVDRAVRAQLVEREYRGRGVVLRRFTAPVAPQEPSPNTNLPAPA